MNGWVKIHRQITEWEWYTDVNAKVLFIHLIVTANHTDKNWKGIIIKRGQTLTSLQRLADETGLTYKQIRTALNRLKKKGEITVSGQTNYTLVTVVKWDFYQGQTDEVGRTRAEEGQNKGRRRATNKNVKNNKEIKNKDISIYSDALWSLYPNKKGKADAYKKMPKLLEQYGYELLEQCVKKYAAYCVANNVEKKYIKHGSTFFNEGYMDYIEEPIDKQYDKQWIQVEDPNTGEIKTVRK